MIDKISTINTNNTNISKTGTWVNTSNTDNIYNAISISKFWTCGSGKNIRIAVESNIKQGKNWI